MTKEEVEAIVQEKMDEINRSDYSKYEALIRRMDNHGQYIETLQEAVLELRKVTAENMNYIKFQKLEEPEGLNLATVLYTIAMMIPIFMFIWLIIRWQVCKFVV